MTAAPERIWHNPTGSMSVEYVRADLLATLVAENERLREAIRPFGAIANAEYDDVPNVVGVTLTFDSGEELNALPFGCFRTAARALTAAQEAGR